MTDTLVTPTLDTGVAAPVVASTPAAPATDPNANPNAFVITIPHTEQQMALDIANIPQEVRLDFLKRALAAYVNNSVNQVKVRTDKANEPFDAYDKAIAADALQTAVPKPTGEREQPDYIEAAKAARERLYSGKITRRGEGTGSARKTVDPLVKLVSEAVVRDVFEKEKAAGGKRKYLEISAEIAKAGGGVEYLNAAIAAKVAAGADEAALRKFMDERYIKPAQMMLGQRTNKATQDIDLFG